MIQAIQDRRSVRYYADRPVPPELVEQVLQAGILAPSAGNRQPWKFVVTIGQSKAVALNAMERGLQQELDDPLLGDSAKTVENARHTLSIMRQAPVLIFVVEPTAPPITEALTPAQRVRDVCNAQSLGAAVENMTL